MPHRLTTRGCKVSLNFAAERVGGSKCDFGVNAFIIDKTGEVVVDNAVAVPTVKHLGFQELIFFMIPDLIVGNNNCVILGTEPLLVWWRRLLRFFAAAGLRRHGSSNPISQTMY